MPEHPLLSAEEEAELGRRIRAGDEAAVARLVEHNIRLVRKVANRCKRSRVPVEDLVQEGCIGLLEAARKFDPDRGNRFSTFAFRRIRWAVHTAAYGRKAHRTRGGVEEMQIADDSPPPDAEVESADLAEGLRLYLDALPADHAAILSLRFGLDGEPMTIDEIADLFGVSRQRVDQVLKVSLEKIWKRGLGSR